MKYFLFILLPFFSCHAYGAKMQCKILAEVNGNARPLVLMEVITDRIRPCAQHSKTYLVPKTDVQITANYRSACSFGAKPIPSGIDFLEAYDQVTKNYMKNWDTKGPQQRASLHFVTNGIERVSVISSCEVLLQ